LATWLSVNDTVSPGSGGGSSDEQPSSLPELDDASASDDGATAASMGLLWDCMIPVTDISYGYDFTYDYRDQYVYWIQHSLATNSLNIERVKLSG
jgi:hypothetical protein